MAASTPTRTLFRSLLRSGRQIETILRTHPEGTEAHLAAEVRRFLPLCPSFMHVPVAARVRQIVLKDMSEEGSSETSTSSTDKSLSKVARTIPAITGILDLLRFTFRHGQGTVLGERQLASRIDLAFAAVRSASERAGSLHRRFGDLLTSPPTPKSPASDPSVPAASPSGSESPSSPTVTSMNLSPNVTITIKTVPSPASASVLSAHVSSLRDPRAELLIGQQFLHKKWGYRGVVFAWFPSCPLDEAWVRQWQVDKLPGGTKQVFYRTLVHTGDRPGGFMTYAAQDNLVLLPRPEGPVEHPFLAQLFDGYDSLEGRHVPNSYLKGEFPDD